MVPVLVLLFVALWFILQGDLFYVLPCVILFLCFWVLLALRLPRLGKRELILVLFVRLLDLRLFGFVCFLFLLVSGKGYCLWCDTLWTFLLLIFFHTRNKRTRISSSSSSSSRSYCGSWADHLIERKLIWQLLTLPTFAFCIDTCLFYPGLTTLSTIFQSYRDAVRMWQLNAHF